MKLKSRLIINGKLTIDEIDIVPTKIDLKKVKEIVPPPGMTKSSEKIEFRYVDDPQLNTMPDIISNNAFTLGRNQGPWVITRPQSTYEMVMNNLWSGTINTPYVDQGYVNAPIEPPHPLYD